MNITIKTRRIAAGSYEVDAPSGTYRLENCPVDTSDSFTAGLPRGPRWMLTSPGEYSADCEFHTKREAVEYVRANEQWEADQAAKQTSPEEPTMSTETVERWESASFTDFKVGDRIQFWTNDNGFGGFGEIWRTGTVRKVTAKTVAVDCDRNGLGNRAVIRRADWSHRCPMKVAANEESGGVDAHQNATNHERFVIVQAGFNNFVVRDTRTELDAAHSTSRSGAQHIADCLTGGTMVLDQLGRATVPQPAAPETDERPACSHDARLQPGVVLSYAKCEHGTQWGVFGDEGSLEVYDCAVRAANRAAEFRAEDPDTEYGVWQVCNEHPDERYGACNECGDFS